MADFEISDGSPWWMSPCIFVRNDPTESYDATGAEPVAGGYENPIEKQDNCVYVKLLQHAALAPGQTARLHLFVGRGGPEFHANTLNCVVPTATWDNVLGNNVVRIPFTYVEDFVEHEVDTLELGLHGDYPGADTFRWYKFKWKESLVPHDAADFGWHPCMLAWVEVNADDPHYDPSAAVSADANLDNNFAQRNLTVIDNPTKSAVKRSVMLGNQFSFGRRLGVVIRMSGSAADGATVTLTLGKTKREVLRRIAVPEKLPMAVKAPASTWYRRLPKGHYLSELRDAPPAWNVTATKEGFVFAAAEGGITVPVLAKELIEAHLEMMPGKRGDQLVVDLAQYDGAGRVVGGVTFDLRF